jgi:hypothetical protein
LLKTVHSYLRKNVHCKLPFTLEERKPEHVVYTMLGAGLT